MPLQANGCRSDDLCAASTACVLHKEAEEVIPLDWFAAVQWDDPGPLLVEAIATLFVWGNVVVAVLFLVLLVTAAMVVYRRRRFWCVQAGRIAEVEFEEVGLPGCRRAVTVHSCSLFSPPTLVTCDRWCLAAEIPARRPLTPSLKGGTQETDAPKNWWAAMDSQILECLKAHGRCRWEGSAGSCTSRREGPQLSWPSWRRKE